MESRTHTRTEPLQDRLQTGGSGEPSSPSDARGRATSGAAAVDREEPVVDMGEFVRGLFLALEAARVRFVVLRHHHGLPDVLTKRDLSLMVDPRDSRAYLRAFGAVCADQGFVNLRNPRRRNALALTAIRFEPTPDGGCRERTLMVDARLDDTFDVPAAPGASRRVKPRVFLDMLRTRTVTRGGCSFPILDARDEFLFLLKHWKRKQANSTRRELHDLLQLQDPALAAWVESQAGPHGLPLGERYREQDDLLVARLLAARFGRPTLVRTAGSLVRASRNRLGGWWARAWPPLAPILYFSGPDGCGKSTLAAEAVRTLAAHQVPHTLLYSLKKYLRYLTHRLAWLKHRVGRAHPPAASESALAGNPESTAGQERWGDPTEFSEDFRVFRVQHDHADRDTGSRSWRARKWAALVVGAADILIGWVMALGYRVRGRTVIVETSPYEVFIKYHMPEFPRTERVLARLMPRPTLGVLVRVDPALLVSRKAELTRQEVEEYYARLDVALSRAHAAGRFIDADNNGTLGEAHARIMSAILGTLGGAPPPGGRV